MTFMVRKNRVSAVALSPIRLTGYELSGVWLPGVMIKIAGTGIAADITFGRKWFTFCIIIWQIRKNSVYYPVFVIEPADLK